MVFFKKILFYWLAWRNRRFLIKTIYKYIEHGMPERALGEATKVASYVNGVFSRENLEEKFKKWCNH